MTNPKIHSTAIVGERVEIGANCEIGPFCILEDDVSLAENTKLMAHVYVGRYTRIGAHNQFFPYSTIGMAPQDLKFGNERTVLEIGNHNVVREHVTLHRGTGHGGSLTKIGDHNLLMVGSHVAHDCSIGDRNILSHAATLAGHVVLGNDATIGAYSGIHQFCRVGDHAFIGGYSVITQDALPFVKSVGNRATIYGINALGLERKGFSKESIQHLKAAYRTLFHKKLRLSEALEQIKEDYSDDSFVAYLIEFIEESERGILR